MAQSRVVVTDKDLGFKAIEIELNKIAGSYVIVGFPESVQTKSQSKNGRVKKGGQSMASIAAQNEFGTDIIPSRPFMRPAVDENIAQITRVIDSEYTKVIEGKRTVEFSLSAIGIYMEGLIRKKIRDVHFPPNAASTIKIKKSSKPLIDFGQMISSIMHKVILK